MDVTFWVWIILVGVVYLLFKVLKLESDIKGMKYTLNRIADATTLPENPIDDDLRDLLKEGKDIQAVKLARETLGLSLLEGKQYVDALKAKTLD